MSCGLKILLYMCVQCYQTELHNEVKQNIKTDTQCIKNKNYYVWRSGSCRYLNDVKKCVRHAFGLDSD